MLVAAILIAGSLGCASPAALPPEPSPEATAALEPRPSQNVAPSPSPTVALPPTQPSELVWEMLERIQFERALSDLRRLTGEAPICLQESPANTAVCRAIKNRKTGSDGLSRARQYVYQELAGLGYAVELQDWSHPDHRDQNLVARKPGGTHPEEEVYFIAHLDGVDTFWAERFPAADDNASGVVDLLEMARVLKDYTFSRTLVLLFSSGEEQGTLGVQSYLNQLTPEQLSAIRYAVNIDVIGYDANQDQVMELWHGDHPPSLALANWMIEIIQAYRIELAPRLVVGCG